MPLDEFNQWATWHSLYPIDGTREDCRSAVVACAFNGGDLEDYIVNFDNQPVQTEDEKLRGFFGAIMAQQKPT